MTDILSADSSKTEAMNDMLADNWWAAALRGAVAILFGIAAFVMPVFTMLSLVFAFAAFSIVDGVVGIVMSVRGARKGERWSWLLSSGIFGIVAGVVAILWPDITLLVFVVVIAVWALISGMFMLISAFRLKRKHGRVWMIIGGLASIVLGLLLVIWPSLGVLALTFWIGAHALVLGATLLVLAYRLRSNQISPAGNLAPSGAA
jgi:uncharacterized membrane protein HdeD (DUF308 family)